MGSPIDPLNAARGCLVGIILGALFWVAFVAVYLWLT